MLASNEGCECVRSDNAVVLANEFLPIARFLLLQPRAASSPNWTPRSSCSTSGLMYPRATKTTKLTLLRARRFHGLCHFPGLRSVR